MERYDHSIVGDVFILRTRGSTDVDSGISYLRSALGSHGDTRVGLLIADFGTDFEPDLEAVRTLFTYIKNEPRLYDLLSIYVSSREQLEMGRGLIEPTQGIGVEASLFSTEKKAVEWILDVIAGIKGRDPDTASGGS